MPSIVLGLLPLLGLGLTIAACYAACAAPLREAVVRGAILWGVGAVASLELLSAVGAINRAALAAFWTLACVAAIAGARMARRPGARPARSAETATRDWLFLALGWTAASIVVITVAVALIAPSNNNDSLAYHLPRIEQWVQAGTLADFSTPDIRQVSLNPCAEMLILHFRLLAGTDRFDNIVQALAFAGCVATAGLVARHLGAAKTGQILAALFVATLPMAILQGSSTQNDLVTSFFLLAAYEQTLVWWRTGRVGDGMSLGAALGLAVLTKGTVYLLGASLVFLFAFAALQRKTLARDLGVGLLVGVVALAVNVGHYRRNLLQFGSPQGPEFGIASTDYRPSALVSALLRNAASNLATPSKRINADLVGVVTAMDRLIGADADSPNTTFLGTHFDELPVNVLNGDIGPNPLHLALIVLTIALVGVTARRPAAAAAPRAMLPVYLAAVLLGGILFCVILRWQPWITRLQLPFFVIVAAPVAMVLDARLSRRLMVGGAVAVILGALPFIFCNQERPLYGDPVRHFANHFAPNIITADAWSLIFWTYPPEYRAYRDAVESIRARAAGGVGIVTDGGAMEYPVWRMLKMEGVGPTPHIEHVCAPDNGSPRSTYRPAVVLAIGPSRPPILTCANGAFAREAEFPTFDPRNPVIDVYHRVSADAVPE